MASKKLCDDCKEPVEIPTERLVALGAAEKETKDVTLFKAVGCPRCVEGYKGRFALLCIKIGVAGAHCQAVGFSDYSVGYYINRYIQVPHHAANDLELLKVLLTEDCHVRPYNNEELGNYCGYTAEVFRP